MKLNNTLSILQEILTIRHTLNDILCAFASKKNLKNNLSHGIECLLSCEIIIKAPVQNLWNFQELESRNESEIKYG